MRLGLASVLLSVVLACSAIHSPRCRCRAHTKASKDKMLGAAASTGSVGAAYFLTNDPMGNYIIGSDIGPDGLLTLRKATMANGVGAHGLHDLGPDGLFSQGSIDINEEKGVLVTVNAGSNTVVAFKIDPTDPTNLTMLGKPVNSYGEFPSSVALNKAGDKVCVMNSGTHDGVSCYNVDPVKGLCDVPNTVRTVGLNQTTPPTGTSGTLSTIMFSEDETALYVAVKGTDPAINVDTHPGFFAVWNIAADGSLSANYTKIPVPMGGRQPFAFAPIPDENAILGADGASGFYVWDLSMMGQGVPGPRSSVTPVLGQSSVCWTRYSPVTQHFWLVDGVNSDITEVALDANLKPTLVKTYPQGIYDATIDFDIRTVNGTDYMYLLAANATALRVMQLGANWMTRLQSLDFLAPSSSVSLPIDPNSVQGMKVYMKQ